MVYSYDSHGSYWGPILFLVHKKDKERYEINVSELSIVTCKTECEEKLKEVGEGIGGK